MASKKLTDVSFLSATSQKALESKDNDSFRSKLKFSNTGSVRERKAPLKTKAPI